MKKDQKDSISNINKATADKAWLAWTDMKELFIIVFSNYRRAVPSQFKEKLMGHFRGRKKNPTKY